MEIKSISQIYFDSELKTKEEVYSFIFAIVCQDQSKGKEEVVNQLYEREKAGSFLISDHVLLPHIESDQIKKSQLLFIRLANPIQSWDCRTKDIRLLIVLLLKKNESVLIKKEIALFIRSLADEAYVNRLLNSREKENFIKEISKY